MKALTSEILELYVEILPLADEVSYGTNIYAPFQQVTIA
jgi:hypothetical protein